MADIPLDLGWVAAQHTQTSQPTHPPTQSKTGVVVFSMTDIPLGFGVAAQPTEVCKDLDPGANVVLHQGDVGEYLRVEDELS